MFKIGIISDTHGLLRDQVIEYLKSCDAILHAGDINTPEIVDVLSQIAPLYIVRGNNDKGQWAELLPHHLDISLGGRRFYMVHQKKDVPKTLEGIDFVIYGHSHQYHLAKEQDRTWLNPGSCGKRRFGLPITMACLILENEEARIEPIELKP